MEFSLTTTQKELQESINKALIKISSLERVRRHAQDRETFASDVWQGLVDLGITGLMIPEAYGGLGLNILDAALVAESLGQFVVPSPFLSSVILAPLTIMHAGNIDQKKQWLPSLASGQLRIGLALSEFTAGRRTEAGVNCRDDRLYGRSLFVIDDAGAHFFIVVDNEARLQMVDRGTPGLIVTSHTTIDRTRSTVRLDFDGAHCVELGLSNPQLVQFLADVARLMLAADMLGASSKMLEQAVNYAKLRQQFGRPIGAFQAVKHMCADMAAELEPARALIWYAAYALDEQLSDATLACMHAKSYMAEASRLISRSATEVHGGMGITDALGLHYWFKRNAWSYQALGSPERLREMAAQLQNLV
jgi:alkylation response protein AidB-like acyl-CoA dehydrogenase